MKDIQEILAQYADGFINGSVDISALLAEHDIPEDSETADLLRLAADLREVLVQVDPSEQFVEQLKQELLTTKPDTVVEWLRKLSAAQQVAAGIGGMTVAAGLFWFARRSTVDARSQHHDEAIEAQPA